MQCRTAGSRYVCQLFMASFGYTIPQVVVDWFAVMAFPLQKSFTLVACNLAELCF
jgi:hypothetical protein